MQLFNAKRKSKLSRLYLALSIFSVLATVLFLSRTKNSTIASSTDASDSQECIEAIEDQPDISSLFYDGCAKDSKPTLYAHHLERSLNQDICLEDILTNNSGSFSCAPGPFTIKNKGQPSQEQPVWSFNKMPDYFVWLVDSSDISDEQFYISNQAGFPIKSNTLILSTANGKALVLQPQATVDGSKNYYIYQIFTKGESRTTWIQPIENLATK